MRTVVVSCDHPSAAEMAVIVGLGALKDALGQADLCDGCAKALLDWLRRGPAPDAPKSEGAIEPSLDNQASASI
jgi:hypothetical protein